jgi:hypothetical protein
MYTTLLALTCVPTPFPIVIVFLAEFIPTVVPLIDVTPSILDVVNEPLFNVTPPILFEVLDEFEIAPDTLTVNVPPLLLTPIPDMPTTFATTAEIVTAPVLPLDVIPVPGVILLTPLPPLPPPEIFTFAEYKLPVTVIFPPTVRFPPTAVVVADTSPVTVKLPGRIFTDIML